MSANSVDAYQPPSPGSVNQDLADGLTPVPLTSIDLDAFLDYVSELAGETGRRTSVRGRPPVSPSAANERRMTAGPKVELVLYTSRESEKSQKAIRAVEAVLDQYVRSQVRLTMCDLSLRPEDGEADAVVFTPTLIKQGPGPRTAIIGNLDGGGALRDLLDASGVDRRWDD